jgi:putative nucleotidyltransferase with HDIG domain
VNLSSRARGFLAAIVAGGGLVLGASVYQLATLGSGASWLVLAGLAVVTGSFMIKVPRIETRFSLSDALVFTSVLLFGPACGAIVAGIDALAASLRFNQRDELFASRTMFNVSAASVSIWIPAQMFLGAGGQLSGQGQLALRDIALPLALLVLGYSLLNTGLIATVVALTVRTRITAVWRENFAWVWIAHAWSGLVAGALAIHVADINVFSLLAILTVGAVGYATVRVYLRKVEESTDRLHKLNDLYLATIKALAMAIDAKDQVTHGHIRRVQVYAVGLAQALGVADEPTLKGIEAGALLHDTGKIAVPEHILNKPGKLSPQEYEKMKTHVTVGADILSGIDFPYPVIPYVRHHHENWNGTGYPDGLEGEAIPLGARILSVVDCFDALTSHRPYRRALTTEAALDILRERSGSMYDPRVVDKFIEIYPALTASLSEDGTAAAGPDYDAENPAADAASPTAGSIAELERELADLAAVAASGLTTDEAAFVLTNRLRHHLRFVTAAVYVQRTADDRLDALHVSGRHADLFRHSDIRLSQGLSGWVAAHGQFLVNANPSLDLLGPVVACDVQLASALVVPFAGPAGARGALALYADVPDAFTLDHARLAGMAATYLSRALRVAKPGGGQSRSQVA